MASFNLQKKIRKHFKNFKPYSSARDEFSNTNANVYLDANENAFGSPTNTELNRYPDPYQNLAKQKIAEYKKLKTQNIFLGNGSDEIIDLTIRLFCEPSQDSILTLVPSYGMYSVSAEIHNVNVVKVEYNTDFTVDPNAILKRVADNTKIVFLCTPNNPTGTSLDKKIIEKILKNYDGLVFIDEAYIDFSPHISMINEVKNFNNLLVCQTMSKAWGLAATRVGIAFSNKELISYLNKIKPPYNINTITQKTILEALNNKHIVENWVIEINKNKKLLIEKLSSIKQVKFIYPSDANFILVKFEDCDLLYKNLTDKGIVVRNRSKMNLCNDCIRITIGTKKEMEMTVNQIITFYG